MTPLYDVLSAWPVIGPGNSQIAWQKCKLAMAVRGSSNHYLISQIRRRHWIKHGEMTGLGQHEVESIIEELLVDTPGVIDRVAELLPGQFPSELAVKIFDGIKQQGARLAGR